MRLFEIFDEKTLNVKSDLEDGLWVGSTEMSDGRELEVQCTEENVGHWSLEFTVDGSHRMTGKGNEIEVMSTAIQVLRKAFDEIDPQSVEIISAEQSRTKLYVRMLKRLLPNWSMTEEPYSHGTKLVAMK